jgi:hypothetical protein
VPKVHNKPIKRPRKGSNKESKRQPKCALAWRTGLSGVPPDSVRCTRELNSELLTFGNSGSRSAIIHRTVRCSTGLSDVAPDCPVCQQSNDYFAPTVVCREQLMHYNAHRSQSRARRRTRQSTGPVRWPRRQKLQRSNPNGRGDVAGAPDCPVRHATTASTNGSFGGWGYKYPQPPTIHCIQVFSLQTPYKSYSIQYKTQSKRSNPLPSPKIIPIK